MNTEQIISAFETLDMKSYIDRTAQTSEPNILRNELRKHRRLLNQLDSELYAIFEGNIESLLTVLEKNSEINQKLLDIKEKFSELRPVYDLIKENDETAKEPVDKLRSQRLRRLLSDFEPNAHSFATKSRFLIHYEILLAEESNQKNRVSFEDPRKHSVDSDLSKEIDSKISGIKNLDKQNKSVFILIFTNDLLILGKRKKTKFELMNAFNYNVISFRLLEKSLVLDAHPLTFTFYKDRKSLQEVFFVYQEITSEYSGEVEGEIEPNSVAKDDKGYVNFLEWTEQYEELSRYLGDKVDDIVLNSCSTGYENGLETILFISNPEKRFMKIQRIYRNLFTKKLEHLQVPKDVRKIIDAYFGLYSAVSQDFKSICAELCTEIVETPLFRCEFVIFNEDLLICVLEKCAPVIYSSFHPNNTVKVLELLLERYLNTPTGDFRYLLALYDEDREKMEEDSCRSVKTRIAMIVDEMLCLYD